MEMVAAFLIGFAASFVGSISTGANLISIPGLIFLGVSPVTAIGTTRLAAISGGGAIIYRYHKGKAVIWRYIPYFVLIAIAAGIIGPKLLLHINEDIVRPLIGILLIASLPLIFLKKGFGAAKKQTDAKKKIIGLLVILVVMTYATMFTLGGGAFLAYALMYFYGLTFIESNATGAVVWLLGAATALVTYASEGAVNLSLGIPLMIGAMIGGYFGAHIALKKGINWIKWFLAVVILISAIKLIFF